MKARPDRARISPGGARRLARGHPWVFRSDVVRKPDAAAGAVVVEDAGGHALGVALWSPRSEISLRLVDRNPSAIIDTGWWHERLRTAVERRAHLAAETTACRLVHAEADGVPSLVCDRYSDWLVVQVLSAGLERYRDDIVTALVELTAPAGILARNDVPVRTREGLPLEVLELYGSVPRAIEVDEHGVRYVAAPWDGQKTGAFLDQRENRVRIGELARGNALDCFSYHGSFALHLAQRSAHVTAVDSSRAALDRAADNVALNRRHNVELVEADAFEFLRTRERERAQYDTIVVDPPAFAKNRASLAGALRGYKEINLRAMRLLSPRGVMFTASCSHHVDRAAFFGMLEGAAADSGRRIVLREVRAQASDHPELLTVPESGYLKAAILEAW